MAEVIDPKNIGVKGLRGLEFDPDRAQPKGLDYAKQLNISGTESIPAVSNVGKLGAGDSRLDRKREINIEEYENLEDYRGREQSGFWQVANGITKGGILAGTTFLQGTIGLINGVALSLAEWDASKFWDNDFNRALKAVNDWSEEALPNYYTDDERENPLAARNIFSWNSLSDKLIKNLGFTVGAFYSGGVWTKPLQAINAIRGVGALPHVASGLGATLSAVNEGSFEAINNSQDWFNLQKAKLDDSLISELNSLRPYQDTTNYETLYNNVMEKYNNSINDLEEKKVKVGNSDLLMNLPILLASNLVEFGKLYARGFSTARKTTGNIVRDEAGNYLRREGSLLGRVGAGVRAATSEGTEEVAQQFASNLAGARQTPREYNLSMYGAGIDPDAEDETIDYMKVMATAINQTFNEDRENTIEQFLIGALTGALGMPTFSRANNRDAYLGKNKVIGLSGGAIGAIRDYNQGIETDNDIVDRMNERIHSPEFLNYYRGILRHQYFQDAMDDAATSDKQKEYKDAEFAQMVSDVELFASAGKIDDYMAMLNEAADTSDENLESIIRNTTKENGTGPFIDSNGNKLTATDEGKEQMKLGIIMRKNEMLKAVNEFNSINESLSAKYGDALSVDQKNELIWLDMLSRNQMDRASEIAGQSKPVLRNLSKVIQSQIDSIELSEAYNGQPLSKKDADMVVNLQNKLNFVNRLEGLDNASLAVNIGTNKGLLLTMLESSAEMLNDNNIQQTRDIIQNLSDVPRLIDDSQKYANKLKEYLDNPAKITEDQTKETRKAQKKSEQRKREKQNINLSNARTFDDVRSILNTTDDTTRESMEKSLVDSQNPIVQSYRNLKNSVNSVRFNLSKNSGSGDTVEDANRLLDVFMQRAQDGTALDVSNEVFVDTDNLDDKNGETPEQKQERLSKAVKLISDSIGDINTKQPIQPETDSMVDDDNNIASIGEPINMSIDDDVNPINNVETTEGKIVGIDIEIIPDESINYSASDSSFETSSDKSQSQKSEMQIDDNANTPKNKAEKEPIELWHPAVAQFDLAGMKNGIRVDSDNAEWKRVNSYISKNHGYEYVNDGELMKYYMSGGKLYFGLDSNFNGDENTIFIYVKTDENKYTAVGSMFVDAASNFAGMQEFNQSILDTYNKLETKPDGVWISNKTGSIKSIKRGRIPWGDAHNVSEALSDSEITTPNIVVLRNGVIEGASDGTVAKPVNASSKSGQAYIEVPNARRGHRGGKSLVAVNPVKITKDILNGNSPIINRIKRAIDGLARSLANNDSVAIGDNIKAIADDLLIQDIDFSVSSDGNRLYINKIQKDTNGNPIKVERNGKLYNRTTPIIKGGVLLQENPIDNIVNYIIDSFDRGNVHIRINKDKLSTEYSKELIDNNLVQTYATTLKSDAAWFEFLPDADNVQKQVQETSANNNENTVETQQKAISKRASIFNKGRSGNAVKDNIKKNVSTQPVISVAREQRQRITTEQQNELLLSGYSQEWINNATQEEIDNAIKCS